MNQTGNKPASRPPAPPPGPPMAGAPRWPSPEDAQAGDKNASATGRPAGFRFDAELDLSEIDDRGRPGPSWTGKGRFISRSNLTFRSRRMCYAGRVLLVAVHLIDDKPVALMGTVHHCDYDGEGQYKVDIDLVPVPDDPEIQAWLNARG